MEEERKEEFSTDKEPDGGVRVSGKTGNIHCLSIIGQIEGHYVLPDGQKATKYEHLIPLLVSLEEDKEECLLWY